MMYTYTYTCIYVPHSAHWGLTETTVLCPAQLSRPQEHSPWSVHLSPVRPETAPGVEIKREGGREGERERKRERCAKACYSITFSGS